MLYNIKTIDSHGFQKVQYNFSDKCIYFLVDKYTKEGFIVVVYDENGEDVTAEFKKEIK